MVCVISSSTREKSVATSRESSVSRTIRRAPARRLFARRRSSRSLSPWRSSRLWLSAGSATATYVSPAACTLSRMASPACEAMVTTAGVPSTGNGSASTEKGASGSMLPAGGKSVRTSAPARPSASLCGSRDVAWSLARRTRPAPSKATTASEASCRSRAKVAARLPSPMPSTRRVLSAFFATCRPFLEAWVPGGTTFSHSPAWRAELLCRDHREAALAQLDDKRFSRDLHDVDRSPAHGTGVSVLHVEVG